jgi:hypothetical protein
MPDETDTIGAKRSRISLKHPLHHWQMEAKEKNRITLWSLLYLWSKIGIQSLGGGSSTLFLIRREFIEKEDEKSADLLAHLSQSLSFFNGRIEQFA